MYVCVGVPECYFLCESVDVDDPCVRVGHNSKIPIQISTHAADPEISPTGSPELYGLNGIEAASLYEQAAVAGSAAAGYRLGKMYESGVDVNGLEGTFVYARTFETVYVSKVRAYTNVRMHAHAHMNARTYMYAWTLTFTHAQACTLPRTKTHVHTRHTYTSKPRIS